MDHTRRIRRTGWLACAGLLATALAASSAAAQTPWLLRGHLLDAQTRTPVSGAYVALQGVGRGVLSDSTGYFALPVPRSDYFVMDVRQLGYRDLSMTVAAESAAEPLLFQLDPDPVEIEGLEVLVKRFEDRRRGPFGAVDVITAPELLHSPDGAASDLVRRVVPFARPCDPINGREEDLCINAQGRVTPLSICVDNRQVLENMSELEHVDPRGLYMVEVFRRGGQVRIYTRGYIERLLATGEEVPPLSFGCGMVSLPGAPIGG
ncbi:MAG: hypothetical protein AMXMBFR53_30610 [Gemmatimonadota bacterium]